MQAVSYDKSVRNSSFDPTTATFEIPPRTTSVFVEPRCWKPKLHTASQTETWSVCILNYFIINCFTIVKKSREKKNPIAVNYYCQETRCWSNQHLWFSKNCKCDLQMFSVKVTNLWFFLLINTLAMQQHLAQLRHGYVADIRIEVSGIFTLLQNEFLLLHLTINHSIICIRQRLTQREDLWECFKNVQKFRNLSKSS